MNGGPWIIFDHYLAVSTWSPDFISTTAKIEKTLIWVRFPGMNPVYYDEILLLALASAVGKPIKMDKHTLMVERGRFARIYVEIDLNKSVVGKLWVRGTWYNVEYEGLHVICGSCGGYGHLTRSCSAPVTVKPLEVATDTANNSAETETGNTSQPAPIQEVNAIIVDDLKKDAIVGEYTTVVQRVDSHGDWLAVKTKKRQIRQQVNNKGAPQMGTSKKGMNKFAALSNSDWDVVIPKDKGQRYNEINKWASQGSGCDNNHSIPKRVEEKEA